LQKVIDVHVHLSERLDDALVPFAKANGLRYTIDELLGAMKSHGVEHGLLLSPPLKSGCLPNSEVIKLCEKCGGKLDPVITVEPSPLEVEEAISLAEENKNRAKAFKIRLGYVKASAEDPIFDNLYDYAESKRLPVLFHTGDTAFHDGDLASSHPLTLDKLANKREELRIVMCHFGNPWFEDVAELIYKHPNVYTDTSGLITGEVAYADRYARLLARRISEAVYFAGGADKVMFGTDYPVTKHADALSLVKMLEIERGDKEKILSGNAKRVFGL
jgi:uncharacterized protein